MRPDETGHRASDPARQEKGARFGGREGLYRGVREKPCPKRPSKVPLSGVERVQKRRRGAIPLGAADCPVPNGAEVGFGSVEEVFDGHGVRVRNGVRRRIHGGGAGFLAYRSGPKSGFRQWEACPVRASQDAWRRGGGPTTRNRRAKPARKAALGGGRRAIEATGGRVPYRSGVRGGFRQREGSPGRPERGVGPVRTPFIRTTRGGHMTTAV